MHLLPESGTGHTVGITGASVGLLARLFSPSHSPSVLLILLAPHPQFGKGEVLSLFLVVTISTDSGGDWYGFLIIIYYMQIYAVGLSYA